MNTSPETEEPLEPAQPNDVFPSRWLSSVLLLLFILAIGLGLRLYRLDEQSLWWDDYNGVAHLAKEDFLSSVIEARRMNPEGAPLYHVLQYAAAKWIGPDEYPQRALNVAISVFTIFLVYLLGRRFFGNAAGLVAALMFAMSPTHIHHAQSLRIYPLAVLIAAIALWSIERVLASRRAHWIWVNAAANGLFCLTHLFGLFGVLAQGAAVFLLLARRYPRALFHWAFIQFLCLLPATAWVYTMAPRSDGDFWHFTFPTPAAIVQNLFGDDIADFISEPTPWHIAFLGIDSRSEAFRQIMDYLMMAAAAAFIAWAAARLFCLWRRRADNGAVQESFQRHALLLCFWFLPVAFLLTLALLWRPVVYPRYTLYACLGLYLLAGAAVQRLHWPFLRGAVTGALCALYAYQLLFLLPVNTRTEWRQAAQDIAKKIQPNDIILVGAYGPTDINYKTFAYHTPPEFRHPILEARSAIDLLEQTRCHFLRHQDSEGLPTVWYVLNTHFGRANRPYIDHLIQENGIVMEFPLLYHGLEFIIVYRIINWPHMEPGAPIAQPPPPPYVPYQPYDYDADLAALGLSSDDEDLRYRIGRAWDDGFIFGDEVAIAREYAKLFAELRYFDLAMHCVGRVQELGGSDADTLHWYVQVNKGALNQAATIAFDLEPDNAFYRYKGVLLALTLIANGEIETGRSLYVAQREKNPDVIVPETDGILLSEHEDIHEAIIAYRRALLPHGRHDRTIYRILGLHEWVSACEPPWAPDALTPDNRRRIAEYFERDSRR